MKDSFQLLLESYNDNRALRLLIQALPFGGSVDSELVQFYTKEKERRVTVFFDELADVKIELTDDVVLDNDFLHKYFITLKAVIEFCRLPQKQYVLKVDKFCNFKNV